MHEGNATEGREAGGAQARSQRQQALLLFQAVLADLDAVLALARDDRNTDIPGGIKKRPNLTRVPGYKIDP